MQLDLSFKSQVLPPPQILPRS